jgi:hypothetical protein
MNTNSGTSQLGSFESNKITSGVNKQTTQKGASIFGTTDLVHFGQG